MSGDYLKPLSRNWNWLALSIIVFKSQEKNQEQFVFNRRTLFSLLVGEQISPNFHHFRTDFSVLGYSRLTIIVLLKKGLGFPWKKGVLNKISLFWISWRAIKWLSHFFMQVNVERDYWRALLSFLVDKVEKTTHDRMQHIWGLSITLFMINQRKEKSWVGQVL